MHTFTCETCGTELKRWEAVLRGNAIDDEPRAWCRRDAVAAGLLVLPMPSVETTDETEARGFFRRLVRA